MTDDSYYWAGGHRIVLKASQDVLVDLGVAARFGLDDAEIERLRQEGRHLTGTTVLLPERDLPKPSDHSTWSTRAVHPVFRTDDGTLLAVLPEVRVEADQSKLAGVTQLVTGAEQTATVKEARPGRLVLEPISGNGGDALTLANTVFESCHPDLAQARFIRVTSRP
jgi:hypothetical protein